MERLRVKTVLINNQYLHDWEIFLSASRMQEVQRATCTQQGSCWTSWKSFNRTLFDRPLYRPGFSELSERRQGRNSSKLSPRLPLFWVVGCGSIDPQFLALQKAWQLKSRWNPRDLCSVDQLKNLTYTSLWAVWFRIWIWVLVRFVVPNIMLFVIKNCSYRNFTKTKIFISFKIISIIHFLLK